MAKLDHERARAYDKLSRPKPRPRPRRSPPTSWRDLPATDKQLAMIGMLCGWPRERPGKLTRGEASDWIERLQRATESESPAPSPPSA